ncbi:MAG: extracellular solute-binding protein [Chitinophagaceae bacterium]|nr:extracellular solute-binding protein [Anaerolineae bacterium]
MLRKSFLFLVVVMAILSIQLSFVIAQDAAPVPDILTLPEEIAGGRPVTITVSDKPTADQPESVATWEATAQRFMDLYPNVTIEGVELEYEPAAFAALIAANQLPTLFRSYFTEPGKFIQQDAVADLTAYIETAGVADVFNPSILEVMSQDGAIYGLPRDAYALGLAYNIPMLEAAGFDGPPETWDELAEMAVALTDRSNEVSGFAFINDGSTATGWHFTNIAYGFGATPQDIILDNGDGTYTATFGEGATVDALEFIQDLRWEYDVLPGATLDWGSISEALVSGRVAMVIYAGDQFNYVFPQFPDADLSVLGYAAAPGGPDGRITLSGGNLWMVSNTASDDEKEAAAYFQLWRQFDPVELQTAIEVTTEAIGYPTLPMYVGDYQTAYAAFREPYNKLPVENYAPFINAVTNGEVTIQAEPSPNVQDYYLEMGVLVSEVLSVEDVDIPTRLTEVAEEFQSFVLDR